MTEETKRIFSAPWTVKHHVHACWEVDFEISTVDRMSVAVSPTEEISNRISHLPELYDKLMWVVVQHCPDAFLALDECRLCPDKKCKYREIVDLLRKVRDGK